MAQELLRRFWHGLTDRIDGPLMLITLIIMGWPGTHSARRTTPATGPRRR